MFNKWPTDFQLGFFVIVVVVFLGCVLQTGVVHHCLFFTLSWHHVEAMAIYVSVHENVRYIGNFGDNLEFTELNIMQTANVSAQDRNASSLTDLTLSSLYHFFSRKEQNKDWTYNIYMVIVPNCKLQLMPGFLIQGEILSPSLSHTH